MTERTTSRAGIAAYLLSVSLLLAAPAGAQSRRPPPHPHPGCNCQRLQRVVRDLEARVAVLEDAARPDRAFTVNCGAGESVQAVLDANANAPGSLSITVVGLCPENVSVTRDDVSIQGRGPGDGFAPATGAAITIARARRIDLRQLRLLVGDPDPARGWGVRAYGGSEFSADLLDIEGGFTGVSSLHSVGLVQRTTVRNADHAIRVTQGSLQVASLTAEDVAGGVQANDAASVLFNGTLRDVSGWAISASGHSAVAVSGSTIENAAVGIFLTGSSYASFGFGSRISGSRAQGVRAWDGSHVDLIGGIVEGSAAEGVQLLHGSRLIPFTGIIRNNGSHGIAIHDTSVSRGGSIGGGEPELLDNAGFGVFCASSPAVAQVAGAGFDAALVTGNGLGASNCPTLSQAGRVP